MIFIDSNIPMYLVGADHPNKDAAIRMLEHAIRADERLVTSAEVLQEILHRYTSIGRRDAIEPAFEALLSVVDAVFPVSADDGLLAKSIVLDRREFSARDALHLAVMQREGVHVIMSFDAHFDGWSDVERIAQ